MDGQDINHLLVWLDEAELRLDTAQRRGPDQPPDQSADAARECIAALRAAPDDQAKAKELLDLLVTLDGVEIPPLTQVQELYAPARTELGEAGARELSPVRGRCPKCGELREFCTCGPE